MTAEERLSLRGQLLAEIEQAEENFAYQREKALRLAAGLRDVAERMERNAHLEPAIGDFEMDSSIAMALPSDSRSLFDFDGALSLLSDLKKHRQTLHNLRMRNSLMTRRNAANTL